MSRRHRRLTVAVAAGLALLAMTWATFVSSSDTAVGLHAYGVPGITANGGIVAGDCYHFDVGVEVWGSPGLFVDEC